jgi:hypothetical protein
MGMPSVKYVTVCYRTNRRGPHRHLVRRRVALISAHYLYSARLYIETLCDATAAHICACQHYEHQLCVEPSIH